MAEVSEHDLFCALAKVLNKLTDQGVLLDDPDVDVLFEAVSARRKKAVQTIRVSEGTIKAANDYREFLKAVGDEDDQAFLRESTRPAETPSV